MSRLSIEQLGRMVRERRGRRGVREVAAEIGISPATLSRIENGKQPDLETFAKVCAWLGVDASEVLGCKISTTRTKTLRVDSPTAVYAHFKADRAVKPETAARLGDLILAVSRAVFDQNA